MEEKRTTFSNERKTYDTVIRGERITLTGTATIGGGQPAEYRGQVEANDGGRYLGDYYRGQISMMDTGYLVEAATLMERLAADIAGMEAEA